MSPAVFSILSWFDLAQGPTLGCMHAIAGRGSAGRLRQRHIGSQGLGRHSRRWRRPVCAAASSGVRPEANTTRSLHAGEPEVSLRVHLILTHLDMSDIPPEHGNCAARPRRCPVAPRLQAAAEAALADVALRGEHMARSSQGGAQGVAGVMAAVGYEIADEMRCANLS